MDDEFPDAFVHHGHDRVLEEMFRAGWPTIQAWIDALPDEVKLAREEHLMRTKWPNGRPGPNRRKNYVLGNRFGRDGRSGA